MYFFCSPLMFYLLRYIKEWVHGDLGRTRPSLSDLLGSKCTFLSLDVYDVRLSETAAAKEEDDEEE